MCVSIHVRVSFCFEPFTTSKVMDDMFLIHTTLKIHKCPLFSGTILKDMSSSYDQFQQICEFWKRGCGARGNYICLSATTPMTSWKGTSWWYIGISGHMPLFPMGPMIYEQYYIQIIQYYIFTCIPTLGSCPLFVICVSKLSLVITWVLPVVAILPLHKRHHSHNSKRLHPGKLTWFSFSIVWFGQFPC